jgi:hypothetical protein
VVADGDRLLVLLGRVRRRIRAQAALEGGITGAVVALAALSLGLLLGAGRIAGATLWLIGCLLGPLLGALWAFWRRPISLAGAARRLDRATSPAAREGHDDRVFIGLCLHGRAPSALAEAAIADALGRASATPLARVAPWRRPRGLGLVAALGAIAVAIGAWPWRSEADDRPAGVAVRRGSGRPADETARQEARAELDRLQRAAGLAGDADLMALIAEAERLLASSAGATPREGQILERLEALASAARASARTGDTLVEAFTRVAEALARVSETRAWAQALSRLEARGSEREARTAADRVAGMGTAERAALAQALARAAAAVQGLSRAEAEKRQAEKRQAEADEKRRRLSGLNGEKPAPESGGDRADPQPPRSSPERSLQRLERDLQESADLCQRDPAACARAMSQAAEALGSEMSSARSASERNQVARALERELARQGEAGGQSAGQPGGERDTEPAAGGAPAGTTPALGSPTGAPGDEVGQAGAGAAAEAMGSSAAGSGAGVGAGRAGEAGAGEGAERELARGPSGEKHEVRVPAGPGPSRSEVIEGGARRGFADPGYRRVYREYEAAIEEALDATEVPPGRRRLVRRYFDLIHPR